MVVVTSTAAEVRHGHAKKPGSKTDKARGGLIKRYPFSKYGKKGAIAKAQAQHYAIVKSQERQSDSVEGGAGAVAVRGSLQNVSQFPKILNEGAMPDQDSGVGSTVKQGPYKPVKDGMMNMGVDTPEQTGRPSTPPVDTVKIYKPGKDTMPSLAEQRDGNGIPYGPASDPKKIQAGITRLVDRLKRISPLLYRAFDHGGEGSGNWGHAGRPGEVGGSAAGDGSSATVASPAEKLVKAKEAFAKATEALEKSHAVAMKAVNTPEFESLKAATMQLYDERKKAEKAVERAEKAVKKAAEPKPERVAAAVKELEKAHEAAPAKSEKEVVDRYEKANRESKEAAAEARALSRSGVTGPQLDAARERFKAAENENRKAIKELAAYRKEHPTIERVGTHSAEELKSLKDTADKAAGDLKEQLSTGDPKAVYEKYDTYAEHAESSRHMEEANARPIAEVRSELSARYGEGIHRLHDDHVRALAASVAHHEALIGRERLDKILKEVRPGDAGTTRRGATASMSVEGVMHVSIKEDTQMTKDSFEKDPDSGARFHPQSGAYVMKATIDHEIGHNIYNLTQTNSSVDSMMKSLGRETVRHTVSEYACTNVKEFAAETWCAYMNNSNPNDIVKSVGDLMLKGL